MSRSTSSQFDSAHRGLISKLIDLLRRLFGEPRPTLPTTALDPDPFVAQLLLESAQHVAESLDADIGQVKAALRECREGKRNELMSKLDLRVDCSLKKLGANRIETTVSIRWREKDDKLRLTQLKREVAWDDLPREIRSEFIRKNPSELCYVVAEQLGQTAANEESGRLS